MWFFLICNFLYAIATKQILRDYIMGYRRSEEWEMDQVNLGKKAHLAN